MTTFARDLKTWIYEHAWYSQKHIQMLRLAPFHGEVGVRDHPGLHQTDDRAGMLRPTLNSSMCGFWDNPRDPASAYPHPTGSHELKEPQNNIWITFLAYLS